jgi:hypothetical protein
MDSINSRWGPVVGPCEHVIEPSASLNGQEFLDQLSNY